MPELINDINALRSLLSDQQKEITFLKECLKQASEFALRRCPKDSREEGFYRQEQYQVYFMEKAQCELNLSLPPAVE